MLRTPVPVNSKFMNIAITLAEKAASLGEVPVGAVIVLERDDQGLLLKTPVIISESYNDREKSKNAVGHAELTAIKDACDKLQRWRLTGCSMYVTLEPCVMCAGAIVLARLDRLIFGATDPKAGAVASLFQVLSDTRLNHRPEVVGGVGADPCSKILTEFFLKRRRKN
jgi:tRNA(adenine34) deaminase